MKKNDFGVWEVVVKASKNGELAIPHNSKIKVSRRCATGNGLALTRTRRSCRSP